MKHISVIIPCYNAAPYLDRCIHSLTQQTIGLEHLELIFVNDASTDNTLELLMQYEKQYEDSILVINCDKNGKQGTARNIGLQYASADYIGFVDADDWIDLTMYDKLYHKAITYNCDIVGCLDNRISDATNIPESHNGGKDCFYDLSQPEDRQQYFQKGIGPHIVCKIYKKSLILDNSVFFPEGLAYEDNYWGSVISYYVTRAYKIDETLYHWYINPDSTTMKRNQTNHFDRLTIEEMKFHDLIERGFYDEFQDKIKMEFLKMYYFNSLNIFFKHFDEVPIKIFERMQQTVKQLIPDYATYCDYTDVGQILIDLIDVKLTQQDLNAVQALFLEKNI